MNIEERVRLISFSDGCATISLSKDIDSAMSEDFYAAVMDIFNERGCDITFECSSLEFIDSTTLGVIVKIYKEVTKRGKKLTIKNLIPRIRKLFEICALDKLMEIA